ncbi:MAG: right-handed parallel beta-helix repeat-containing protein, partial [Phycisphaerales bacterium JB061]
MRRLIPAVLSLAVVSAAHADIFRVDDDAAPNGDGSSWARAFDSLTDALAVANSGDQIWVAGGRYIPDTPAGSAATFNIPDGVQVYGGFDGDESTLAQRGNPLSPISELNGARNSYHVVTMNNVGPGTVLDGFRITLGLADGTSTNAHGGGLFATDSAPIIRNVRFEQNIANSRGGGAYFEGSPANFVNITNCEFNDNSSALGAALYSQSATTVQDCQFTGNSDGPAYYITGDGIQTIDDSTFRQNTGGQAGAIRTAMDPGGSSIITDCVFTQNEGT